MKILIVEDNEDARILQKTTLEAQGHTVESAVNGKQALEMAMRSRPDLIISDILMPEMDGFALCQAVKEDEQLRTVPFVFHTASYVTPEDEKLAKALGATRFIVKTGDMEEFLKAIEDVIKEYKEGGPKVPGPPAVGKEELEHMHKEALVRQLDKKVRELEKEHEALEESEKKFQDLYDNAPDMYVSVDAETAKILRCNQTLATALGYSKEEIIGQPIYFAYHPDSVEEAKKAFQSFVTTGEVHGAIPQLKRKDGSKIDVSLNVSSFRDKKGKILYSRSVWRDITELKQAEERLKNALKGTIQALATTVETRDPYTAGHQQRVTVLACAVAEEMGLSGEKIEGLRMAGVIHDVGKIGVPAEILTKPGRITAMEFEIIKTHPQVGYDILKGIEFPWPVAEIVLQHQERMDGSGYPQGLSGDEILMEARIIAVADTVEAMASHRPYRAALGIDAALDEISKKEGVFYDPDVVDACVRLFREKGFAFK